jgi:hypothetical protein
MPMYMRQAIVTKYLEVTNSKPSRVKATAEAGSVTLSWDNALNTDGNHAKAAATLANKFGWRGNWRGGAIPGNSGFAFIWDNDENVSLAFIVAEHGAKVSL